MPVFQGRVGQPTSKQPGTPDIRLGAYSEQVVTELHGRFYEQNYNGNLFSIGSLAETALSANTITLVAATTPIIGIWNPSTSTINAVILQASLTMSLQGASSTRQGAWVWASSLGNTAISTGSAPINRKSLSATGSQCKGFPGGVALTGLTNNIVIFEPADFAVGVQVSTTSVTAATDVPVQSSVQNFDGSLIVPPGGVLALLNTNSTTNMSCVARLLWEEVSV